MQSQPNLVIKKMKKPSHKCRNLTHFSPLFWPRCLHSWRQESKIWEISPSIHQKDVPVKNWCTAVILSLIKTLHYTSEAHSELDNEPFNKAKTDTMNTKIQEIVRGHPSISSKDVLRLLSFSDAERDYVESTSSLQWQREEWYIHKIGFISASKGKGVFTRHEAIEKTEKDVKKLGEDIVLPKSPHSCG